jgi:hypothetical protein
MAYFREACVLFQKSGRPIVTMEQMAMNFIEEESKKNNARIKV